jgi:zinc transporter ZupT
LVAIGAGFMLAALCLEFLPAAYQQGVSTTRFVPWLILTGYLLIFTVSRFFTSHAHTHKAEADHHTHQTSATRITGALAVHAFFDGVTIATGLKVSGELGMLLVLATLMHKIPEGFTVASVLLRAGRSTRVVWQATTLIAAATFFGMLSILFFHPSILYSLPLAAGVTLYVVMTDLIPDLKREWWLWAMGQVAIGIVLFLVAHWLMHLAGVE